VSDPTLPPRYEPKWRLGQGGGGEVWAVRDRITDRTLAFKVLAKDASEDAAHALVREATALSGLEGLGVPRVVAFGALADGRRYLVRELVEGKSLEEILEDQVSGRSWLVPLAHAADQLTALHRAGLLHGDVKPANVIVGPAGRGTLVDLGLAAPWKEGGAAVRGLTPRYAAPELFDGAPLGVRAEVYSLGATLAEGLALRGHEVNEPVRSALAKVAARATERDPKARYPSADELASALRHAAGIPRPLFPEPAWPVVGLDAVSEDVLRKVRGLAEGAALAIDAPQGAGRTTLVRRIAWTLAIEGRHVVTIDAPSRIDGRDVLEIELSSTPSMKSLVLVVDDAGSQSDALRSLLKRASTEGARLVAIGTRQAVSLCCKGPVETATIPPLPKKESTELVRRALPSLSEALASQIVDRADGRPGRIRAIVRALGGRTVVGAEDLDAALVEQSSRDEVPTSPADALDRAEHMVLTGRLRDAARLLAGISDDLGAPLAIARAKVITGYDARKAIEVLAPFRDRVRGTEHARPFAVAQARAYLRAGMFAQAMESARGVTDASDGLTVEALATTGVAEAFLGNDHDATQTVLRAVDVAREIRDRRAEGFALGSLAVVHQRAARMPEAKTAYEGSLEAAEEAHDAATVAAGRLNLAGLARADGDLAAALAQLEATVDLGSRAGGLLAVQQARFNLANLDLFLGRHARASAAIDALEREHEELGPPARAQLLGLRAELAARNGDPISAARLYEESAAAWDAQRRTTDAAEARLESIFVRAKAKTSEALALALELAKVEAALMGAGTHEHSALAKLARGMVDALAGREDDARKAFDEAIANAEKGVQRERAWQALEARAELHRAQGNSTLARKDLEAAISILEEIASKLPRDLREVFWDEPARRRLRSVSLDRTGGPPMPFPSSPHQASNITITSSNETRPVRKLAEPDRLARILEITRELVREHDLPRLLAKVTDHAIALLGGERGFVVLRSDSGELETFAARDRAGDDPHAKFSRSVAERVLATGEPVVTTSARDDERLAHAVSVHQLMIQSVACVPVRGAPADGGRTIGALYVETRLRPGVKFEQELPTLMAFADQAAIAIENARLLETVRARSEELEKKSAELEIAKDKLADALGRKTEQLSLTRQSLKEVRSELRSHFGYAGLVGTSAAMRKVYALIDRVKDTDIPVLITGESGTGKEVVARAIHQSGPRGKKNFLGVNCGAIPANLLESELFGHVRGAFTGADRDRRGLFRESEGGTLLLDEIGEMPLKMQPSMLRTLQEKTVRPVGAAKEEPVDVRVIAATNRDLEQMVKDGTFREDLFYRLHVIEVRIPPLRERADDIPALIDHFLGIFAARHKRERKSVEKDAQRHLCDYHWPGNVRQLEHVLLNAWLMGEGRELAWADFTLPDTNPGPPTKSDHRSRPHKNEEEYRDSERERILKALAACNWNRVQAAKMSGIPRRTFYRRLKEFGII
jgi:transcriptional regulator with GAF, ATPase, and Fis domain/tetratricopeptide (TPR) repeat protein